MEFIAEARDSSGGLRPDGATIEYNKLKGGKAEYVKEKHTNERVEVDNDTGLKQVEDATNAVKYYNVGSFADKTHLIQCSTNQNVRGPPECEETIAQSRDEPNEDQHGDVEHDDNFTATDLLCFAWQIAKGMVRYQTRKSRIQCKIY